MTGCRSDQLCGSGTRFWLSQNWTGPTWRDCSGFTAGHLCVSSSCPAAAHWLHGATIPPSAYCWTRVFFLDSLGLFALPCKVTTPRFLLSSYWAERWIMHTPRYIKVSCEIAGWSVLHCLLIRRCYLVVVLKNVWQTFQGSINSWKNTVSHFQKNVLVATP